MLVVSDDAADRLRVTEMAVGAQDTAAHAAVLHAARHLLLGALVVVAENSRFCHHALRHTLVMHRAAQFEPGFADALRSLRYEQAIERAPMCYPGAVRGT
jgi:hypothetical protein